jgi:hypothetical protein
VQLGCSVIGYNEARLSGFLEITMWLARAVVKVNLIAEMTPRFPARRGVFPETLKISALGFPNAESLREWGKSLNRAAWFTGWFAPSEFLACTTFGRDPRSDKPNLIDLMFNTQTRPPERTAAFTVTTSMAGGRLAKKAVTKKAKKASARKATKKAGKKTTKKSAVRKSSKRKSAAKKGRRQ